MTQRLVHRPARTALAPIDLSPVQLYPPPALPDNSAGMQGLLQVLMPIMGGAGSLIMIVANRNPVMLIAGGIMLTATVLGGVALFVAQRTGTARRASDLSRRYLDYLDRVRDDLAVAVHAQRDRALRHHPDPGLLTELIRDPGRLWERRPGDPDFLVVRVGTGPAPLWQRVVAPADRDPLGGSDIVIAAAIARIIERDRMVGGMPIGLRLRGRVSVVGPAAARRRVVTCALAQLVALHGPGEVKIFACVQRRAADWLDWLKWLPHALSDDDFDGAAPRRMVTDHPDELVRLLAPEISRRTAEVLRTGGQVSGASARLGPGIVVVVGLPAPFGDLFPDLPPGTALADLGICLITMADSAIDEPEHVDARVSCGDDAVAVDVLGPAVNDDGAATARACGAGCGTPDVMSPGTVTTLAKALGALRLGAEKTAGAPLEGDLEFGDLTGVDDPADFDTKQTWAARSPAEFLRVAFAVGPAGQRIVLDLKEPALGGMGPHGLCVGATGSGKSEVLRTLVLTLAMTHPPDRLSMVLVDYKGGATFAGLDPLPHCAAMVSNLSDDAGLVDRLHDALIGEVKRRQQLLSNAGNLPNITEYSRRREAGDRQCAAPLPNLFVVIDEFGELLAAKPDFIDLFLAIGRTGRSIGVHLLLASQRLEEGRLRGLESFLSYRIALRTFNVNESRAVLGSTDAFELPSVPGSGYLKVDSTVLQRFRAGYVSSTYRAPADPSLIIDAPPVPVPFPLFNDTAAYLVATTPPSVPATSDEAPGATAPTVLDVAVGRLASVGDRVGQIWLPPLPLSIGLDVAGGPAAVSPVLGLRFLSSIEGFGTPATGSLTVALGLVDLPSQQRQQPFLLDLAAAGGHLAVLGAPQTGKSNLLRTLVVSTALSHQPGEVSFYCLDLGGGSLRILDALPHVAGVASRLEADRVRRTVAEVFSALAQREELFARLGVHSVEAMRTRFREGRLAELEVADIFLVVDNFPALRSDFDDLSDPIQDLATRGPGYGIHLILTAGRWSDLRTALQATMGQQIEFRLNDTGDSVIGRKQAANLRADTPGRCLIEGGLQAQICLPQLAPASGEPAVANSTTIMTPTLEQLVAEVAGAWPGHPVPAVRMLPLVVDPTTLTRAAGPLAGIVLGLSESDLQPVELDWRGPDAHLLVIGDAESGKTSLLRLLVADLVSKYTDEQVVFAVFDVRRTLLDVVPDAYLGAYAGTASTAVGMAAGVAGELRSRLPPDDVTAAQLRRRSWWRGPEIFVLVDDYDLLGGGGAGPLAPLLEFLPQARDVGLHLVLTRRSGGAGRSLYEPLLQRLREVGATGLLLSGDRQEGAIYPGVQLSVQPPGRATLVRRGRAPTVVQIAHQPIPAAGLERPDPPAGSARRTTAADPVRPPSPGPALASESAISGQSVGLSTWN